MRSDKLSVQLRSIQAQKSPLVAGCLLMRCELSGSDAFLSGGQYGNLVCPSHPNAHKLRRQSEVRQLSVVLSYLLPRVVTPNKGLG